ncbi:MAG: hypothetical protein JKY09_09280, partial [Crocinitomicaceae bacterium]|nr:hypothetical protein [Crocinitomicaceae bacterium]
MKLVNYISVALLFAVMGCAEKDVKDTSYSVKPDIGMEKNLGSEAFNLGEKNGNSDLVELEGVLFRFREVSALSYLVRKGETILEEDKESLENESVFMLEFAVGSGVTDIFNSPVMELSPDDATQYLVGKIVEDF